MRSKSPGAAAAERESEGKDKERAELVGNGRGRTDEDGRTDGDRGEIRQVSALARSLAPSALKVSRSEIRSEGRKYKISLPSLESSTRHVFGEEGEGVLDGVKSCQSLVEWRSAKSQSIILEHHHATSGSHRLIAFIE